jgi:phage terminase large subunit-like protein
MPVKKSTVEKPVAKKPVKKTVVKPRLKSTKSNNKTNLKSNQKSTVKEKVTSKPTSDSKPVDRNYSQIAIQYCNDVLSGKILSCEYVKLSCKRHLDDIERSKSNDFPYYFNETLANKRCAFSEKLTHVKGKWRGTKIKLEPFQIFIQSCLWGWVKKKNDKRRFSFAYVEEPRKNAKSTDAATSGLYMLVADGEKGAEIYSGATTEKQALEVFRPSWQMVHDSESFKDHFEVSLSGTLKNPTSIYRLEDMSRFELIVGNPGDGASPHCAIIDEYHEHRTSDQLDTMETGMGAREQPLILVITTAGTDTSAPCYDLHLKAIKVLNKTIVDESFFAIIFTIDTKDNYSDFNVWKKANPNYLVSIEEDYLIRKYKETLTDASKQNINLCKHLNVWTNAGVAWMNMAKWAACSDPTLSLSQFSGQPCYAALDLASKIDICSLLFLFDSPKGYIVFCRHYLPEETVNLPGNDHYVKWSKEGHIIVTPGARTDFKYIEDDLKEIHQGYRDPDSTRDPEMPLLSHHPISELAFDPKEATYLINNIMEWMGEDRCIEMNQSPTLMSEPMKEVEARVYSQTIWWDGDPVLNWMMGNVVRKQGRNSGPVKYYYPTKEKNEFKIDGAVCMIMSVGRAMLHGGGGGSPYDGLSQDEIMNLL